MSDETTTRTRTYIQVLEQEVARLGRMIGAEWVLVTKRSEGRRVITMYNRLAPGRLAQVSDELEQTDFVLWLDGVRKGLELTRGGK